MGAGGGEGGEFHLGEIDVVGVVGEAGEEGLDAWGRLLVLCWLRGECRTDALFWHWLVETIF